MKKLLILFLLICIVSSVLFAQTGRSIFVSARGNNENNGLSEATAVRTLSYAIFMAGFLDIYTITVIGTLDRVSEGHVRGDNAVFNLSGAEGVIAFLLMDDNELLITGRPGATGTNRAVLSGRGSNAAAVIIGTEFARVRFEHIDIINGEGEIPISLGVEGRAQVTLGPGANIRNSSIGIIVANATCLINGADVSGNNTGIIVGENAVLTLRSGTIRNNRDSNRNGGGVAVLSSGRFTMSGGTISGNAATRGGGVYVASGGRFDQTAGTISNNTAPQGSNPNIFRVQGSLGSNLTPAAPASGTAAAPRPAASTSAPSTFGYNFPFFSGFYLQGWNENTFSVGIPLQLGLEFNFGRFISTGIVGEIAGGLGGPFLLEFNYGFMGEIFFSNKTFGLGYGRGNQTVLMPYLVDDAEEMYSRDYDRLAIIFRSRDSKTSFYVQRYGTSRNFYPWDSNGWDLSSWGFGASFLYSF